MSFDRDTEWAFIRRLATGGLRLGPELTVWDRSERIRTAILQHKLEHEFLGLDEDNETCAQAFKRCYGRSLDSRRIMRDTHGRPLPDLGKLQDYLAENALLEDDEDDEDEPL